MPASALERDRRFQPDAGIAFDERLRPGIDQARLARRVS